MARHVSDKPPPQDRHRVESLLEERIRELHRNSKMRKGALQALLASQEAILEEVIRRAQDHKSDGHLLQIIDLSILESRCYQKLTTDTGLKFLLEVKIRTLRTMLALIARKLRIRKKRSR